jgi:hypothetical protein
MNATVLARSRRGLRRLGLGAARPHRGLPTLAALGRDGAHAGRGSRNAPARSPRSGRGSHGHGRRRLAGSSGVRFPDRPDRLHQRHPGRGSRVGGEVRRRDARRRHRFARRPEGQRAGWPRQRRHQGEYESGHPAEERGHEVVRRDHQHLLARRTRAGQRHRRDGVSAASPAETRRRRWRNSRSSSLQARFTTSSTAPPLREAAAASRRLPTAPPRRSPRRSRRWAAASEWVAPAAAGRSAPGSRLSTRPAR